MKHFVTVSRQAVAFSGRAAGILLPTFLIFAIGPSSQLDQFIVGISLMNLVAGSLGSILEVQAVREFSAKSLSVVHALAWSAVLGSIGAVVAGALMLLGHLFSPSVTVPVELVLPLSLSALLATTSAPLYGNEIYQNRWVLSGLVGWLRILPALVLAVTTGPEPEDVISGAAVGLMIGETLRFAILLASSVRRGQARDENTSPGDYRRAVVIQVPSGALSALNPALTRWLVGAGSFGSVALLDIAEKAAGFLSLTFTQAVLPKLSRDWTKKQLEGGQVAWREMSKRAMRIAWVVVVAVGAGAWAAMIAIGTLDFDHNVPAFVGAFVLYLVGVPGYVGGQVIVRGLIAARQHGILVWSSLIQLASNTASILIFGSILGIAAAGLGSAVAAWVGLIFVSWVLKDG